MFFYFGYNYYFVILSIQFISPLNKGLRENPILKILSFVGLTEYSDKQLLFKLEEPNAYVHSPVGIVFIIYARQRTFVTIGVATAAENGKAKP